MYEEKNYINKNETELPESAISSLSKFIKEVI